MITISPMMIRIAELRMRSAPMIGPTVVTDRTVAGPNLATSAFSRSSNGVPGTTVGAELGAETAADADGRGVGVGAAVGFAVAEGDAVPGASEALGAAVEAGNRSTGAVRIRRRLPPSGDRVTCASGCPNATRACWTACCEGWLAYSTSQVVPPVKSMVGFSPPSRTKIRPGIVIRALNRKYQRFLPTMSYIGQRST